MKQPKPKEREVWIVVKGDKLDNFWHSIPKRARSMAKFFREYYEDPEWQAKKFILREVKE